MRALLFGLLLYSDAAMAWDLSCAVHTTTCIATQGTRMPTAKASALMDECADFTYEDMGRRALKMSAKEALDSTRGRLTPLMKAWVAFGVLYDSPLQFHRKSNAEDTDYNEIKRSCLQLSRDFENPDKWVR